MRRNDPNLPILLLVADALGDLREELVFVGGSIAGLLLTDPAAMSIRATRDVDAVVEATTLAQYYVATQKLPARGFVPNADSTVICRWKHRNSGALFDIVPVDPAVLGFSNRWYAEAVRTATRVSLREGLDIRLVTAPAFVATKLVAFADRGRSDYLVSHDLEDVLTVVDGRPELCEELRSVIPGLRAYIAEQISGLLRQPDFADRLPGLLADENRAEIVLERLHRIAA
jgi:hypothetical protein